VSLNIDFRHYKVNKTMLRRSNRLKNKKKGDADETGNGAEEAVDIILGGGVLS